MDFILFWKNKGFFVPLYFIVFFVIVLVLGGVVDRNFGLTISKGRSRMILYGFTFILSGIFSIITDVYTIENRKLVLDEFQINEFYFISMKKWGYFFIFFGLLNIIGGILEG